MWSIDMYNKPKGLQKLVLQPKGYSDRIFYQYPFLSVVSADIGYEAMRSYEQL